MMAHHRAHRRRWHDAPQGSVSVHSSDIEMLAAEPADIVYANSLATSVFALAAERGVPVVGLEPSCLLTLRDEFLKTMEAIVPWAALCAVIEPHYPKAGNGRPPIECGHES